MKQYFQDQGPLLVLLALSAGVSFILLLRLWIAHPRDPFFKKLRWSFVLLVPFFGWLFYGAFYTPLAENNVRAPVNMDGL